MIYKIIFFILSLSLLSFLPSCGGEKGKPNILLITIDTLRRDHLGIYGYHRDTTPFIDRLAKEGLRFENVITPIPLTAGSHASMLTSLHPLTHNLVQNGFQLSDKVQTIAEVYKKNGYYTIGAVAVGIITGKQNFSQGFDSFSDKWEKDTRLNVKFPLAERTAKSVNESLFKQIAEYLGHPQNKTKPLFIWVHYFDPHGPYYDKDYITFKERRRQGEPKGVDLYDKEIRYTDDSIEELYAYLAGKGITKRLTTCITADHGEQLGEHGYTYGHADFYSETTFVPLIFHGCGIPKNKTIATYVSTMDIGITLLAAAGLAFDYPIEGIDLLKKNNTSAHSKNRKFLVIGNPVYARSLQLIKDRFAFILNFDYHYRYWFISGQTAVPEDRFKPIPGIENRGGARTRTRTRTRLIPLPYSLAKGRNYAVLRMDIKKCKRLTAKIQVKPFIFTNDAIVTVPAAARRVDIIYPVTIMDRIIVSLTTDTDDILDNFRYALISKKEFPTTPGFNQKIENAIYTQLNTLRKDKRSDELFNLSDDMAMEKSLADIKEFKTTMGQYRRLIYTAFTYYYEKQKLLLKGSKTKKTLTDEEKKMLESLGYF